MNTTSNIAFNNLNYDAGRIAVIATEGIKITLDLDKLVGLDNAFVNPTIEYLCVAAVGEKFQVLVKPSNITPKTTVYLMSKIILKKCNVQTEYVNVSDRPPRNNFDDRPRRSNNYRDNTYRDRSYNTDTYSRNRNRSY